MCISSPETNSWSVIYRKNSGEDINITSLTFKNSLLEPPRESWRLNFLRKR